MTTPDETDHMLARHRGERIRNIADAVITALLAEGVATMDRDDARVVLFNVLVDELYGSTAAIDIPPLRGSRAQSQP